MTPTIWLTSGPSSSPTQTAYSTSYPMGRNTDLSKGWFDRVKHVRKTDKILSYILHARNADTHGVERITQDSNLVSIKIRPLSSYKDDEPIKGKIVDNAIVIPGIITNLYNIRCSRQIRFFASYP